MAGSPEAVAVAFACVERNVRAALRAPARLLGSPRSPPGGCCIIPFDALVLHLATVAAMVAFLVWLWAHASDKPLRAALLTFVVLAAWLAGVAALALAGITLRTDLRPPGGFLTLGPALLVVGIVLFTLTRARLRTTLYRMPLEALLWAQAFRFPVEIVLAMLADAGLLPRLMTFHGSNFDILTALTAPLAAGAARRGWWRAVIAWNLVGLALVINVVGTAILAFSGPLNVIKVVPPADFAMTFPMVWLPGFLVPVAILLHGLALLKAHRARAA